MAALAAQADVDLGWVDRTWVSQPSLAASEAGCSHVFSTWDSGFQPRLPQQAPLPSSSWVPVRKPLPGLLEWVTRWPAQLVMGAARLGLPHHPRPWGQSQAFSPAGEAWE